MTTTHAPSRGNAALWASCQIIYIAFPLIVYAIFFHLVAFDKGWEVLSHKPEWAFIALIYNVESLRDWTALHGDKLSVKSGMRDVNLILDLFFVIMSSLVLFAALGSYEGSFNQAPLLAPAQWLSLAIGIFLCWQAKYHLKRQECGHSTNDASQVTPAK